MKKVMTIFGAMLFASVILTSCNNSKKSDSESSETKKVEVNTGTCEGAQEFANTLDTRLPACFKADGCEKRDDGTFVVHLTSHCGDDMVNDGRGSYGEREARIGYDGKEYYTK
jgi:hypothetical protein